MNIIKKILGNVKSSDQLSMIREGKKKEVKKAKKCRYCAGLVSHISSKKFQDAKLDYWYHWSVDGRYRVGCEED